MKKFLVAALIFLTPLFASAQTFRIQSLVSPVTTGWVYSDGNLFDFLTASATPFFANAVFGNATTSSFAITSITSGNCLQTSAGGQIVSAGAACGSGGGGAYPFQGPNNSTSTLTGFTAGIYSTASSTIGNGTTGGGLTVNGGATTTGQSLHLGSTTLQNFTFVNGTGTSATTTNLFSTNASTTNLWLATGSGCLQANSAGLITSIGSNCGTGAVSSVTANGTSLTISPTTGSVLAAINLTNGNIWTAASTTFVGGITLLTSTTTSATTTNFATTNASTSVLVVSNSPSALLLTSGTGLVGKYGGASACAASNFVTSITGVGATTCGTATISGVNLGSNLNSLNHDVTLVGTAYNGSAAVSDWGIDLTHQNVWTGASTTFVNGVTFGKSTTTSATTTNFFATTASTTSFYGAGLAGAGCTGANALTYNGSGGFGCTAVPQGTVTSVATNNGVTGGTITTSGTLSLDQTFGAIWTAASTTFVNGVTIGTATITSATTSNFYSTNLNAINASTSALTTQTLLALSSTTLQKFTFTNGTGSQATTTNFYSQFLNAVTASTSVLTTQNLLALASTTLQNFTFINATGTNATTTALSTTNASTTNLWISSIGGSTQCLHADATGKITGTGSDCGSGAGAVSSVSNSDGTLTISPTSGAVVASLNLGAQNVWTGASTTFVGLSVTRSTTTQATTTNFYSQILNAVTASTTSLTTQNLLALSSSTLQNFTFINATGTSATTTNLSTTIASTTNLIVSNSPSALLLTSATGLVGQYGGASACSSNNFVTAISGIGATTCGTATISGIGLGSNLNSLNHDATFLGTAYNGSAAVSNWGIDLTHQNVWTAASTTFVGLSVTTATATSATTTSNFYSQILNAVTASTSALTTQTLLALSSSTLQNFTFVNATGSQATTTNLYSTNLNAVNASTSILTTQNILALSSTTLQNFTGINATVTNATTSSFAISNIASGNCLHTTTGGAIVGLGSDCSAGANPAGSGNEVQFRVNGTTFGALANSAVTNTGAWLGIGTITPQWLLQLASSTAPQLTLSDGLPADNHWTLRNSGGFLYFATASPSTFATATNATLIINGANGFVGIGSSTPNGALSVGSGVASSSIRVAAYDFGKAGNIATATAMTIGPTTANTIFWPIGTSATTLTLCNFQNGDTFKVIVQNPNGTAGALTWATCAGYTLYWPGGAVPTQTTTSNKADVWSFVAHDEFSLASSTTNNIIMGALTPNF
jgi:hypothetical protein